MSGQATAKLALTVLKEQGYVVPTGPERKHLAMAFAGQGKVVYGKAFDAARIAGDAVQLNSLANVMDRLGDVRLFEVKSTDRQLASDFSGHFFSLSTAELLVAQSLRGQFGFLFVNVRSGVVAELTLQDVFSRAKAIYPSWSIQF